MFLTCVVSFGGICVGGDASIGRSGCGGGGDGVTQRGSGGVGRGCGERGWEV